MNINRRKKIANALMFLMGGFVNIAILGVVVILIPACIIAVWFEYKVPVALRAIFSAALLFCELGMLHLLIRDGLLYKHKDDSEG